MSLIALKPFLDGQGRTIEAGDTLPDDYDQPTLDHYTRLGMVGEGKTKKPAHRTPEGKSKPKKAGDIPPEDDVPTEGSTPLEA